VSIENRISDLKNTFSGERCFILGNGPSLNKTNLHFLEGEYVWGFNKIYLLFDRISWRPKFYVANDPRLTQHISEEVEMLVGQLPESVFFFPSHFHAKGVNLMEENIYWYKETPWVENGDEISFSLDPSRYVMNSATVTIAGLQLAAYMGFNPIYLVGCDTSYSVPGTVHLENGDPELLTSTEDDDPNHFSPKYSGKGDKWTNPNVGLMVRQYEHAHRALEQIRVEVYNATVGGELEVFRRVEFESLFDGSVRN